MSPRVPATLSDLERRIAELERRFDALYPPVHNCPKCGKKLMMNRPPERGDKCSQCGHTFP